MLRIGLTFGMGIVLLCFQAPVWAQDGDAPVPEDDAPIRPTLQSSGLDDDDDLLDPDLDIDGPAPAATTSKLVIPPHDIKIRIDDESAAIAQSADAAADEMAELARALEQDRDEANAEIQRRTQAARTKMAGLETKIGELEDALEKKEKRTRAKNRKRGTYGTPIEFKSIPRRRDGSYRNVGKTKRPGERQFKWWQRLTLKSTNGLHRRLKGLNVSRANELKARADAIAMGIGQKYREYANYAIDEAVGSSRFAHPVRFDNRLKDLILPGNNTNTSKQPKPTAIAVNYERGDEPLVLLPRVRGPDGRVRVIVDRPLGGPFTAPVVPEDAD